MRLITALCLVSLTFISCGGGYTTGTIQKAEKSFLKFSGTTQGILIAIDEGKQFVYDPKIDLYEIKPGKHNIRVYRDGKVVVERNVIIDNQITFEIEVP